MRARASCALLLAAAALLAALAVAEERRFAFVSLQGPSGAEARRFKVQMAQSQGAATLQETQGDAPQLALFMDPANRDLCRYSTLPRGSLSGGVAIVALRGSCPFSQQAHTAAAYGAVALFVVDTIDAMYGFSEEAAALVNPCSVNCDESQAATQAACEAGCGTRVCAANPRARAGVTQGAFCCAVNTLLPMRLPGSNLLAFFAGVADAPALVEAASAGSSSVQVFKEDAIRVDGSAVLILLLGTGVMAAATYRAASEERARVDWVWTEGKPAPPLRVALVGDDDADRATDEDLNRNLETNMNPMPCLLGLCGGILLGVIAFVAINSPRAVDMMWHILFGISSVGALSMFMLQPLIRTVWPSSQTHMLRVGARVQALGTADEVLGFVLAVVVGAVWFGFRHASWAWVLWDTLAAAICCLILVIGRSPNLRLIACAMVAVTFMVDIYLLVFHVAAFSRPVMAEVATASVATAEIDPANNMVCERTVSRLVSFDILVPRFDGSGYAMLQRMDVYCPGLLVTYACRFDYLLAKKAAKGSSWLAVHRYYVPVCAAYLVGLFLALTAKVLNNEVSPNVQGRPALIYTIPLILGTMAVLAHHRGELGLLLEHSYQDLKGSADGNGNDDGASVAASGSDAAELEGVEMLNSGAAVRARTPEV